VHFVAADFDHHEQQRVPPPELMLVFRPQRLLDKYAPGLKNFASAADVAGADFRNLPAVAAVAVAFDESFVADQGGAIGQTNGALQAVTASFEVVVNLVDSNSVHSAGCDHDIAVAAAVGGGDAAAACGPPSTHVKNASSPSGGQKKNGNKPNKKFHRQKPNNAKKGKK